MGKVLEKMLIKRVKWHLLPKTNNQQYGFVPQKSTEDALYDLMQQIHRNLSKKELMIIVSLDIEGAFNGAWWPSIKSQLIQLKCPLNLRRLINSYFEGRKVTIRYAGRTYTKNTYKGCVQGSIGGPTFWNLLLDPLLNDLTARGVHVQAFADDVVLMFSGHSTTKIQEEANKTLAYVHEWGVKNKLKFAAHKTNSMVITRKRKFDTPIVHMNGVDIPVVDELRLLGLTIDKKLTFNSHVTNICRKAANIYKQLAKTAKIEWGLSSEIIRTIYVAVIEPIILYASSAWASAAGKWTVRKQFNTIQRYFALKICKAYRTVSFNAALLLTGLLPLDLRVMESAKLYDALRGRPSILTHDMQIEKRISYADAPHPAQAEEITFAYLTNPQDDCPEKQQLPDVQIYTDGSKLEGKVGAAYTYWRNGHEVKSKKLSLESFCTVFQAELYALYQATEQLLKEKLTEVAVLSDSRSALEMIQNHEIFHPLGFEIRKNIAILKTRGCDLRLFWVKAHVGVPGNERADKLAKEAALNAKCSEHYYKCPVSYAKSEIRRDTKNTWNERYKTGETAGTTKIFFPDATKAYSIIKKIHLVPFLTQALTGHGGFSEYLYRFKCKESPQCICDEDTEETILHLLLKCPKYEPDRCDLEIATQSKLTADSICELMAMKDSRPHLIAFCTKVAGDAMGRNSTR